MLSYDPTYCLLYLHAKVMETKSHWMICMLAILEAYLPTILQEEFIELDLNVLAEIFVITFGCDCVREGFTSIDLSEFFPQKQCHMW